MCSAWQDLVANYGTCVFAERITCSTKVSVCWTTQFRALMLFTWFELIANSRALKVINLFYLFLSHKKLTLLSWVVDLVTSKFLGWLSAGTLLLNNLFAAHAIVIVAFLCALVLTAGKEPFAEGFTGGDGVCAIYSLPSDKFFNWIVTGGIKSHSRGVLLAGVTLAQMTNFLAGMLQAIKVFPASLFTW